MSSWDDPPVDVDDYDVSDGARLAGRHVVDTAESDEEEEIDECPLCMEELDLTDLAFRPCMMCEYQICLWCYHQMLEQVDPKCPACRAPFDPNNGPTVAPDNIQRAAQHLATQQQTQQRAAIKKKSANAYKERSAASAAAPAQASGPIAKDLSNQLVPIEGAGMTPLSEVRVVQRNLCIAAGTPINLAAGVSQPIESLAALPSVLAYDESSRGLHARPVTAFLNQGAKECVSLCFADGRTLTCTPDHRLLRCDGSWVEAAALKPGVDYVQASLEHTPIPPAPPSACNTFQLHVDGVTLPYAESLAFARVLGFAHFQQPLSSSHEEENEHDELTLRFQHEQDAIACAADVASILSAEVPPPAVHSVFSSSRAAAFELTLPSSLTHILRSATAADYLAHHGPHDVRREYLAGWCGSLAQRCDVVSFDSGRIALPSHASSAVDTSSHLLATLLSQRHDVHAEYVDSHVVINDLIAFMRNVGFRYAGMAQFRLTVIVTANKMITNGYAESIHQAIDQMNATDKHISYSPSSSPSSSSSPFSSSATLPLFRLQLVSRTSAGVHPVYDLSVPPSAGVDGSFLAASIACHNCYTVGLSSACGREDLLRKREWFGGFGRAMKVAVAKSFGIGGQATFACYVTYKDRIDAQEAIKAVNTGNLGILLAKGSNGAGGHVDGEAPRARASFGTTKYCAAWLRGHPCTKGNCLYLHHLAPLSDCCTKDQLQRDRFDERFGVGKKTTTTSVLTANIPGPSEISRAVSVPTPMTATSVIGSFAAPKALSFASVTASSSSSGSGLTGSTMNLAPSPPPSQDDFPPLSASVVSTRSSNNHSPDSGIDAKSAPQRESSPVPPPSTSSTSTTPPIPEESAQTDETVEPLQHQPASSHLPPSLFSVPDLTTVPVSSLGGLTGLDPTATLESFFSRTPIGQMPQVSNVAKSIRPPPGFGAKINIQTPSSNAGAPSRAAPPGFGGPPIGQPTNNGLSAFSDFSSWGVGGGQSLWDSPFGSVSGGVVDPHSHSRSSSQSNSNGLASFGGGDWTTLTGTNELERGIGAIAIGRTNDQPQSQHEPHSSYNPALLFQQSALFSAREVGHLQPPPPGMVSRIPPPPPPTNGFDSWLDAPTSGSGGFGGPNNPSNPSSSRDGSTHATPHDSPLKQRGGRSRYEFAEEAQQHAHAPPSERERMAQLHQHFLSPPIMQPQPPQQQQSQQPQVPLEDLPWHEQEDALNATNNLAQQLNGGGRFGPTQGQAHYGGFNAAPTPQQPQQQSHSFGVSSQFNSGSDLSGYLRGMLNNPPNGGNNGSTTGLSAFSAQDVRGPQGPPGMHSHHHTQHQSQSQSLAPRGLNPPLPHRRPPLGMALPPSHLSSSSLSQSSFPDARESVSGFTSVIDEEEFECAIQQQQQQQHQHDHVLLLQHQHQQQQMEQLLNDDEDDDDVCVLEEDHHQNRQRERDQHQWKETNFNTHNNDDTTQQQQQQQTNYQSIHTHSLHSLAPYPSDSAPISVESVLPPVEATLTVPETIAVSAPTPVTPPTVTAEPTAAAADTATTAPTTTVTTASNKNARQSKQKQARTTTQKSTPVAVPAVTATPVSVESTPTPIISTPAPSSVRSSSPAPTVPSKSTVATPPRARSGVSKDKVAAASVAVTAVAAPTVAATTAATTKTTGRANTKAKSAPSSTNEPKQVESIKPTPIVVVDAPTTTTKSVVASKPASSPKSSMTVAPAPAPSPRNAKKSTNATPASTATPTIEPAPASTTSVADKPTEPEEIKSAPQTNRTKQTKGNKAKTAPATVTKQASNESAAATATASTVGPSSSVSSPVPSPRAAVAPPSPSPPAPSAATPPRAAATAGNKRKKASRSGSSLSSAAVVVELKQSEEMKVDESEIAPATAPVAGSVTTVTHASNSSAPKKGKNAQHQQRASKKDATGKSKSQATPASSSSLSSASTKYVISTSNVSVPASAPVFLAPHVSPAALVSAMAHHAPPSSFDSSLSGDAGLVGQPSLTVAAVREVWRELVHLGGLVRSGRLGESELQEVLDSLAEWAEMPRTVEELLKKADDEEEHKQQQRTKEQTRTEENAHAHDGEEKSELKSNSNTTPSSSLDSNSSVVPSSSSSSSSSVGRFTYPHLLELRVDASLAHYYDLSYRAWEQSSSFSQQLCREIYILQQQLQQNKFLERNLKKRMEEARTQLEHALMGEFEGEEIDEEEEQTADQTGEQEQTPVPL